MPIEPVERTSVSQSVFTALTEDILTGRFTPGETLPSERDLATGFDVNRHAVREALKRLQQVGLVAISQGGPTKVLDWRSNAGLDALIPLAHSGRVPPVSMVNDLLETRAALGIDCARLCALRANPQQVQAVLAAAQAYPVGTWTIPELSAIDFAFWIAVVEGSNNIAYRLGLNTLASAIAAIGQQHLGDLLAEYADRDTHLELAAAIKNHDPDFAHRIAQQLLTTPEKDPKLVRIGSDGGDRR